MCNSGFQSNSVLLQPFSSGVIIPDFTRILLLPFFVGLIIGPGFASDFQQWLDGLFIGLDMRHQE
jgi:hypothetical protein